MFRSGSCGRRRSSVLRIGPVLLLLLAIAVPCAVAQEPGPRRRRTLPRPRGPPPARRRRARRPPSGNASRCRWSFPPAAPGAAPRRTSRHDCITPQPGDIIWLRNKEGQLVPTVFGLRMEQFLEFLRSKNSDRNEPDYSISSISLTGSCDDELAHLTAKIDIQVERDGVWLAVPIALADTFLVPPGMRQTGPGEFSAGSFDRVTGYTVYVRGKGLHEISMPLLVPIRRQLNQRHLQLTIPSAAGTQLSLRVPKAGCQVKPIEGAHVYPTAVPHGTRIEAFGLKGQFDLAWDIPIDEPEARTVFDVASKLTLGMEGVRIQLHAVQTIDPKQGTVSAVRVRMPTGFATISGQQKDVADARKYTAADLDSSGFIKVALKPAASGQGRADLGCDKFARGRYANRRPRLRR